jgi:hypothetical protein
MFMKIPIFILGGEWLRRWCSTARTTCARSTMRVIDMYGKIYALQNGDPGLAVLGHVASAGPAWPVLLRRPGAA